MSALTVQEHQVFTSYKLFPSNSLVFNLLKSMAPYTALTLISTSPLDGTASEIWTSQTGQK